MVTKTSKQNHYFYRNNYYYFTAPLKIQKITPKKYGSVAAAFPVY